MYPNLSKHNDTYSQGECAKDDMICFTFPISVQRDIKRKYLNARKRVVYHSIKSNTTLSLNKTPFFLTSNNQNSDFNMNY